MPIRHPRRRLALLATLVAVAATAGCTHPTPTASSGPPAPPVTTTPATVLGPLTHPFGPRRALFTANVPDRFTDVVPGSSQAAALPQFASALANGSGALAVDRQQGAVAGYTPVIGGLCSLVKAQNADELAVETRQAVLPTADRSAGGPAPYEVDHTAGFPRVTGTYRSVAGGRKVDVIQVAGLAAPGKACVLTMSTTDISRDGGEFNGVVRSFRVARAG